MSALDSLNEALVLTRKMLELAREDEWEKVRELEQRQSAILKSCFQSEAPLDRSVSAEAVQEILDLHEKIFEVASHFGNHAKKELSMVRKGRDASRAYLSNST